MHYSDAELVAVDYQTLWIDVWIQLFYAVFDGIVKRFPGRGVVDWVRQQDMADEIQISCTVVILTAVSSRPRSSDVTARRQWRRLWRHEWRRWRHEWRRWRHKWRRWRHKWRRWRCCRCRSDGVVVLQVARRNVVRCDLVDTRSSAAVPRLGVFVVVFDIVSWFSVTAVRWPLPVHHVTGTRLRYDCACLRILLNIKIRRVHAVQSNGGFTGWDWDCSSASSVRNQ